MKIYNDQLLTTKISIMDIEEKLRVTKTKLA